MKLQDITEKWAGNPKIEKTGRNTNFSAKQLRAKAEKLSAENEERRAKGLKSDPKKSREIKRKYFAARAKEGWT